MGAFGTAGGSATTDGGTTGATSITGTDGTNGSSAGTSASSDGTSGGGTGVKFDTPDGATGASDGEMGCQKVDFLFVIDNSGSMLDEQQNLVSSFPGFISTIQSTLQAQNYHIMVVDTDESPGWGSSLSVINGEVSCMPEPDCCIGLCNADPNSFPIQPVMIPDECGGKPCSDWVLPPGCPIELGAGKAEDTLFEPCNFVSGQRYLTDAEPDLNASFECAALVGAGGDGNERPMDAMVQAVGPLNAAGECNEGFLRDDAILVVTFITDEEEEGSMGDPNTWKQALVTAKNGDENAVVVLGLVGEQNAPCDAEDSPRLRQFAESFPKGQWASICQPDYKPFFEQAVADIDAACDDFVPPG